MLLSRGGSIGPEDFPDAPAAEPERGEPAPVPLIPELVEPAVLTGRVTGRPADSGAWVALVGGGRDLKTGLEGGGRFRFMDVPAGKPLALWLGPDDRGARLEKLAADIVLGPGEVRHVELAAAGRASLCGRVIDAEKGVPLAGARVAVLPRDVDWREAVPVATTTGEDGRFYIGYGAEVPREPLRLVVDHVAKGYVLEERIVDGKRIGAGHDVVVKLTPGLCIGGRVVDAEGRPIPNAEVHLLEDYRGDELVRRPSEGRVRTDAGGRFTDDGFRPGVYRAFVSGVIATNAEDADSLPDERDFALVEKGIRAGDEELEIRFRGWGELRLIFADATTREPVVLESVVLDYVWDRAGDDDGFEAWDALQATGEATWRRLPEGYYRVTAKHRNYEPVRSQLLYVTAGAALGPIRFDLSPRAPARPR